MYTSITRRYLRICNDAPLLKISSLVLVFIRRIWYPQRMYYLLYNCHHNTDAPLQRRDFSLLRRFIDLSLYTLWSRKLCPFYGRPAQRMRTLYFCLGVPSIFLSSFFLFFSSPNLSGRRVDVYHTSTHDVALVRIQDAGRKCAARGSVEMQDPKKSPKIAIWAPSHNFVGLYLRK